MSLGDFSTRQQKLILSFMIGGPVAVMLASENIFNGLIIGSVVLAYLSYQIGRALEHDKMKQRRWYSEDNYDKGEIAQND